jgi:hypothetical protein
MDDIMVGDSSLVSLNDNQFTLVSDLATAYPVPAEKDELRLIVHASAGESVEITATDLLGRSWKSNPTLTQDNENLSVNEMFSLAKGVYFLTVGKDKKLQRLKVVIE